MYRELFEQFLEEEGILNLFRRRVNENSNTHVNYEDFVSSLYSYASAKLAIKESFNWNYAPEGWRYWSVKSREWMRYLERHHNMLQRNQQRNAQDIQRQRLDAQENTHVINDTWYNASVVGRRAGLSAQQTDGQDVNAEDEQEDRLRARGGILEYFSYTYNPHTGNFYPEGSHGDPHNNEPCKKKKGARKHNIRFGKNGTLL